MSMSVTGEVQQRCTGGGSANNNFEVLALLFNLSSDPKVRTGESEAA